MLIDITHPHLAGDLLTHLRRAVDVVVAQVADDKLLVGFLGSRGEAAQREELEARLLPWRQAHPQARIRVALSV